MAALRAAPAAQDVTATEATWQQLAALVDGDPALRGNFVPDAWLAALALSHGAALVTRDRGFSRYRGCGCSNPSRPAERSAASSRLAGGTGRSAERFAQG